MSREKLKSIPERTDLADCLVTLAMRIEGSGKKGSR